MTSGRSNLLIKYGNHIESDILKSSVETREDLYQLEVQEFGEIGLGINWENWDKLVQETQKLLLETDTRGYNRKFHTELPKWVYDANTHHLLGFYDTTSEASRIYKVSSTVIANYASTRRTYWKKNLLFSNQPLTEEEFPIFTKGNLKRIYAYRLSTGEYLGSFNSQTEAEKHFGMPTSQIGYCLATHDGIYQKGDLKFTRFKP